MLPKTFIPMLATTMEPFDSPEYTYEVKWDGYRCLAFLSGDTRLQSRNQKDISSIFPELRGLHFHTKKTGTLLDGEIIALDGNRPSFARLQQRAQLQSIQKIKTTVPSNPVIYVAFDLLYFDGRPVFNEPIEQRRILLAENIQASDEIILANFIEEQGIAYLNAITQLQLEGVMAKKKGSPYFPGKRSKVWLKFKHRKRGNFVICGYTLNPSSRGELSSFILGAYELEKLRPFGMVGTGLSRPDLANLQKELVGIATPVCPFTGTEPARARDQKKVQWLKPLIVCEVEYLEITTEHSLRHPSFKRFRPDLNSGDCRLEDGFYLN